MLANYWIKLPQRDALFGVVTILLREVTVVAFAGNKLDDPACFFPLRHDSAPYCAQ
jgi:hypothetical protein